MHPGINGPKLKDKPAIIMAGSGDVISHQELNESYLIKELNCLGLWD